MAGLLSSVPLRESFRLWVFHLVSWPPLCPSPSPGSVPGRECNPRPVADGCVHRASRMPQICRRLFRARMYGAKAERPPLKSCSLYYESCLKLDVTVEYQSPTDPSARTTEELTAVYCASGMSRDVWAAESSVLGSVVLKLTEQLGASAEAVNAQEMQMLTTQGPQLQKWCAEIYFNQDDLEVMLPDDWGTERPMTNKTKSQKGKNNKKFQLMMQEKLLGLKDYLAQVGMRFPSGDAEGEKRLQLRADMIKATGELLQMIMDMIVGIEATGHRLKDGTAANIGVRLDSNDRAESVVVLDVEAIAPAAAGVKGRIPMHKLRGHRRLLPNLAQRR